MFAGAAREAVFSKPDVIARIAKDFIPVALKAGSVQRGPSGPEGALYRELKRTQPAPQGICVMNSAGKVLNWTLMFEDDSEVVKFLDHAAARYRESPDATRPVAAEIFQRFPNHRQGEIPDHGNPLHIPDAHGPGDRCPGELPVREGDLPGKVVGRAIGTDGKPLSMVRTQDNYIEDRFEISRFAQGEFIEAAMAAGGERFRVPPSFGTDLAGSTYLGMLDVNPLGGEQIGGRVDRKEIDLWAKRVKGKVFRLWGKTRAEGGHSHAANARDGRRWKNAVNLKWQGYVTLTEDGKVEAVTALAEGEEQLQWGRHEAAGEPWNDVAHLPAGRPINFDGKVRFGVRAGRE